jgi:hypothetical protein
MNSILAGFGRIGIATLALIFVVPVRNVQAQTSEKEPCVESLDAWVRTQLTVLSIYKADQEAARQKPTLLGAVVRGVLGHFGDNQSFSLANDCPQSLRALAEGRESALFSLSDRVLYVAYMHDPQNEEIVRIFRQSAFRDWLATRLVQ